MKYILTLLIALLAIGAQAQTTNDNVGTPSFVLVQVTHTDFWTIQKYQLQPGNPNSETNQNWFVCADTGSNTNSGQTWKTAWADLSPATNALAADFVWVRTKNRPPPGN